MAGGVRSGLSPRESEVLRLAATGMTDQQIANTLGIRVSTVTTYWIRIRSKVGHLNRAELIAQTVSRQSEQTLAQLRAEVALLRIEKAKLECELERKRSTLEMAIALLDEVPMGLLVLGPDESLAIGNRVALQALGLSNSPQSLLNARDLVLSEELRPLHQRNGWTAYAVEPRRPHREKTS